MSYRFMRVILFFDLPTTTAKHIKAYNRFLKHIKREGFVMMQESVYVKLAITQAKADALINRVEKEMPKEGLIDVLIITEKQFAGIITLLGERETNVITTDERLIEL